MSNIIIVGCGRVGSQLANMLSDAGNNVCCIDRSAEAFANLGRNFNGSTVQGIGFDEDALTRAGIEECDVLAAVTQYDNTNLMCAEVANRLVDVPHVIARLYNPGREVLEFSLKLSNGDGDALSAPRSIRVAELEHDHDVRIIAFERGDGSSSSIPTSESVLYDGDMVLACIRHDYIQHFEKFMQG